MKNMLLVKRKETAKIYVASCEDLILSLNIKNLIINHNLSFFGLSFVENVSTNNKEFYKFKKCFFDGNWYYISENDLIEIV